MKKLKPILNTDYSVEFSYNRVYSEGIFLAERSTAIQRTKESMGLKNYGDHKATYIGDTDELLAVYLPPGTGHNEAVVIFASKDGYAPNVLEMLLSLDKTSQDIIVNAAMSENVLLEKLSKSDGE